MYSDRFIALDGQTTGDGTIPCRNAACPDPGDHLHTIDSRDDLDAARWGGYWPADPTERCIPTGRTGRDGRRFLSCGSRENPAGLCCEHGQTIAPAR